MDAGGAISHHHGIGINRARFLPDALGAGFDVLARVKQALDPHGILNPGKLGLPSPFGPVAWPVSAVSGPVMSMLVVDVGTSGVRGAVVRADGTVEHIHHVPVLPDTPFPGLVEFDAVAMAAAVVEVATPSLADEGGPVEAVGIANQRASTIVWDRANGVPVGPGLGWQDLRTVGTCLELQAQGIRVAPNASATKLAALLDLADPDRSRSRARRARLRHGRHLGGLDAVGRRPARHRRLQRRGDRPAPRRRLGVGRRRSWPRCASPTAVLPDHRRLLRRHRRGEHPRRAGP